MDSSIDSTSQTAAPAAETRWLDRLLKWTLVLACGMAVSKSQADPDFWGHVQYGRDALQGGLPRESTYTFTAVGHRWINHENLAELAFAVGVDRFGPASLLILKCLSGMAVIALMLRRAERQGVGQVAAFTGALLVAGNLMLFWTLRPQLFSFMFFVLLLLLIDRVFADWDPRRVGSDRGAPLWKLWPAAPLMMVWANTHGGFLAGYCVLGAYLGVRSLEALWAVGRGAWPWIGGAAGWLAVCGLATLLNPYGWELHRWLLASLGQPRPEIVEWLPPEWALPWTPFWLLAAALVASLATSRARPDACRLAILGLTLWQSLEHRRHIVFLAILFGFWALPQWDALLRRLRIGWDRRSIGDSLKGPARGVFGGCLAAALALLACSLWTQLRQIPVRHDSYPVAAFQYMADHGLEGNLATRLKWAQYAIAAFATPEGPGAKVAFDGRFRTCYPQTVVDLYFDFADGEHAARRSRSPLSPPPRAERILECGPDLVLIDRSQSWPLWAIQRQSGRWTLLYQDQLAQLWGASEKYGQPGALDYLAPELRAISDTPQTAVSAWPALPHGRAPAADAVAARQRRLAPNTSSLNRGSSQ